MGKLDEGLVSRGKGHVLVMECCDNEYSLALTADLVLFPACLIGRSGDFRTSKARFYDVVFWNSMKPNQI